MLAREDRKVTCRRYYELGKQSKFCPACNIEKPLTDFPISRKRQSGRASHCKQCRKDKYPRTFSAQKISHLRHRYGIEFEEYARMFDEQKGRCAICETEITAYKTANVDHCHTTGKVRGLLCFLCNSGLGKFKDDKGRLQKAIEYLDKF